MRVNQRFLFWLSGSFASVVALFATLVIGCGRDSTVRDLGTRAVVIGVDGADWKIIDALVAEGELPNFEHLRRQGVWGKIATLPDIPLSPVIWTSVATGKTGAKHGVAWFMVGRPDGIHIERGPKEAENPDGLVGRVLLFFLDYWKKYGGLVVGTSLKEEIRPFDLMEQT